MENPKDHRLGMRVIGYFALIFVLYWGVNVVLGVIPNWVMNQVGVGDGFRTYVGRTLTYGLRVTAVILLSAWALHKVHGVNPWAILFSRDGWWKDLLVGFLLAFGVMLLIFLVEVYAGWLVVDGWQWQIVPADSYIRSLWLAVLINLVVAVGEEVMFRGFLLSGLREAWGNAYGLLIMALLFAALHLSVQGAEETFFFLFILFLSIPGVILGWAFLRTRSLWLPIGIHFSWNFMQDEILNLHGRGPSNLLGAVTQQSGPQWIVGTTYGVEVGLVGILGMAIICLAIWLYTRRHGRYP